MEENEIQKELSKIPQLDSLLGSSEFTALLSQYPRELLADTTRKVLDTIRENIRRGGSEMVDNAAISEKVTAHLKEKFARSLCRVINGTGVIIHTGLGRSLLPEPAVEALDEVLRGYCLLETDRETGKRSSRLDHITELLSEVTGAEEATVVNNDAAAVLLVLNTLAVGGEVICARSELVEIGGSFRLPDVMERSGAQLVEVGTTNRVYISDYENAITDQTALLFKAHMSNYRIVGYTASVTVEELAALGSEEGIPVIYDVGSGCLTDVAGEPSVREAIRAGADLVSFSGDKMLGGPQAGIIVGKRDYIEKIEKNPLRRALRIGKMTLIALEATLKLYLDRENIEKNIPTVEMIKRPIAELEANAVKLKKLLDAAGPDLTVEVTESESQIGGGSIPDEILPSKAVAITSSSLSPTELGQRLRTHTPCIFSYAHKDKTYIDIRTLLPGDVEEIATALAQIVRE